MIYVRRGQGTFVSAFMRHTGAERRRDLTGQVAKRAFREARRTGLDAEELVKATEKMADEEARAEARRNDE